MRFYFWKSQLHVRFKAWKILAFKWYILARKYQLIIWILAQKYQLEMRYFSSNAILNFTGMDCPHFGGISWSWNLLLKLLWDLIFNLQKLYLIDDWSITSTSLATPKKTSSLANLANWFFCLKISFYHFVHLTFPKWSFHQYSFLSMCFVPCSILLIIIDYLSQRLLKFALLVW